MNLRTKFTNENLAKILMIKTNGKNPALYKLKNINDYTFRWKYIVFQEINNVASKTFG